MSADESPFDEAFVEVTCVDVVPADEVASFDEELEAIKTDDGNPVFSPVPGYKSTTVGDPLQGVSEVHHAIWRKSDEISVEELLQAPGDFSRVDLRPAVRNVEDITCQRTLLGELPFSFVLVNAVIDSNVLHGPTNVALKKVDAALLDFTRRLGGLGGSASLARGVGHIRRIACKVTPEQGRAIKECLEDAEEQSAQDERVILHLSNECKQLLPVNITKQEDPRRIAYSVSPSIITLVGATKNWRWHDQHVQILHLSPRVEAPDRTGVSPIIPKAPSRKLDFVSGEPEPYIGPIGAHIWLDNIEGRRGEMETELRALFERGGLQEVKEELPVLLEIRKVLASFSFDHRVIDRTFGSDVRKTLDEAWNRRVDKISLGHAPTLEHRGLERPTRPYPRFLCERFLNRLASVKDSTEKAVHESEALTETTATEVSVDTQQTQTRLTWAIAILTGVLIALTVALVVLTAKLS